MYVLVKEVRIKQGMLRYRQNDKNIRVDASNNYRNYFNAIVLEKVNAEHYGKERCLANDESYLALHRKMSC